MPAMSAALPTVPPPAAAQRSARCGGLYGDQDGAIMVMGVFIAIVLVGLLFYVAGVGNIVFRRERMQDAADAVALATAIGHARGMNLIVFINLVMAALVAILLALKLIELLLTGLMLILAAISWLVPPAATAIPIVNVARTTVKNVHDAAREIIDNVLIGLNMAERAIAYVTPVESVAMASAKVTEKYGNVVDAAVAVPTRITLPVENDKYDTLCNEGAKMIEKLIEWATGGIPFISKVISMATGVLLDGVKRAYCYQDGTPPPSTKMEITRQRPIDQEPGLHCEEDRSHLKEPSQACLDWEQELRERHPEADGDCVDPRTDTQRARLCRGALVDAREQCQPGREPRITSYSWSEQELEEHVVFDVATWSWVTKGYQYVGQPAMHNTMNYADAQSAYEAANANPDRAGLEAAEAAQNRKADPGVPCDDGFIRVSETQQPEQLWSPWNLQPTFEEFRDVTRPVCDKRLMAVKQTLPNGGEIPPETADHRLPPGFNPDGYTLRYPTVKQVYSCSQKDEIDMTFPAEWQSNTSGQNGEDKAPQKIEEGVLLGAEDFQIRGVAVNNGQRPFKIDRGLFHGAFDRKVANEDWVDAARLVGKVAVAQAEYYFNHDGVHNKEPYDWMWNMDWRARLVRFRLPSSEDDNQGSDSQSEMDVASLSGIGDKMSTDLADVAWPKDAPSLESLEQLIVH
jgi:hypothetical protein